MNRDSNFYTIFVCTSWIRYGTYICILDYLLSFLCIFYFKLNIPIYYYLIQWITGSLFYIYMEYSMIKSYKLRKKTYLFIRSLLKEHKQVKYNLIYAMRSSLCELACLHSLEREFKVKLK